VCGGSCVDTQTDPRNCGGCGKTCSAGGACQAGSCRTRCVAGATACSMGVADACVVLGGSDPLHCGACGTACGAGQTCVAGTCRDVAPAVACNACPCGVCDALLGVASTCCAPPAGWSEALCVAGGACK
jgi:hypothetical protein